MTRRDGSAANAIPLPDEVLLPEGRAGSALRRAVEAALAESTEVDPGGIVVEVIGREVWLGGVVHSSEERDEAEWAAGSVPGVLRVEDRLVVEADSR